MSEVFLDNITVGELISKNLFGENWKEFIKFIIPRKGNFINPQLINDTDTYAIYWITEQKKRILNYQEDDYNEKCTYHYATLKTSVTIQFIGVHAEEWARSTLFWDERIDVQENFFGCHSQLLVGNRSITSVPFQQDGYNGEISYLASFDCISNYTQEEIQQYLTDLIILKGSLTVEN